MMINRCDVVQHAFINEAKDISIHEGIRWSVVQ